MQRSGFELSDGSLKGGKKQVNPQESRRLAAQLCIQLLEHACQCRGANCHLSVCQKMKRIVLHHKSCTRKSSPCVTCMKLIAVSYYHAKTCQKVKCPVPCCKNMKNSMAQKQNQVQFLTQRIATMQIRGRAETATQASPWSSSISSQASLEPKPQVFHLLQPGIGMKPTACPLFAALRAVQQVQAAAARQTMPHMVANARQAVPLISEGSVNYGNNPIPNHFVFNTSTSTDAGYEKHG